MTKATTLIVLLCLAASAADETVIATQAATGPKPQATSYGTEAISIPQMLSYQGKLTDSLGVPVADTTHSVEFRLYSVPSGGSPFWSETQQVRTKTGLFSVLLGSVTPIDSMPASGAAHVGMAIEDGSELTPRLRIASAAYAYLSRRAADAELLQGKDTIGFVRTGQTNSVTTGMVVDGTIAVADLGQMGASTGQVMKWNGSAWAPRNDSVGNGGGGTVTNVSEATGVVCSPNPITDSGTVRFDTTWGDARFVNEGQANSVTGAMIADDQVSSADIRDTTVNTADLKDNAITSVKILDAAVTSADLRDTTVNTADVKDAAVTMAKLNQAGAATGQVIKWTGSAWAPRNDSIGGTGDNAWMRSGSDSVLYTVHQLGLARSGNTLLGNTKYTHVNLGAGSTTGSAANDSFVTISGGKSNSVSAAFGAVGGGTENQVAGDYAVVAGGEECLADGVHAGVLGGGWNEASGGAASISGGEENLAYGDYASVGGGYANVADQYGTTIGGGENNYIEDEYGTIGGGVENSIQGSTATVGGGEGNEAACELATIGGGYNNVIADSGREATIAGGVGNTVRGEGATIGGGQDNSIDSAASWATIAGGEVNAASGEHATVSGGAGNEASGGGATVGGGDSNVASGDVSAIAGGTDNVASGDLSSIAGGEDNLASGAYSSVAGGWADSAAGDYSFTVGNASMVPADYENSAAFNGTTASASNQVRVNSLVQGYGAFAVDDPRDPDRMILNQYSVASSEMVMIYRGSAELGSNGRAEVTLPSYFNGLCRNPMVQLTGVGSADVVYVAEDVFGNHFTVGGKPGMKVYWTVTAERKDPTAEIGRTLLPVEQAKTGALAGRSLDDAGLAGAKRQLERLGLAADFDFRTAAGRQRYENAKQTRTLGRRDRARTKVTDRRLAAEQHRAERKRLSAERKAARLLQRENQGRIRRIRDSHLLRSDVKAHAAFQVADCRLQIRRSGKP